VVKPIAAFSSVEASQHPYAAYLIDHNQGAPAFGIHTASNIAALFISEGTVKSHGKAIFAKMNVVSRTEAVADATRRGLIRL
jgi:hypothetical protein